LSVRGENGLTVRAAVHVVHGEGILLCCHAGKVLQKSHTAAADENGEVEENGDHDGNKKSNLDIRHGEHAGQS